MSPEWPYDDQSQWVVFHLSATERRLLHTIGYRVEYAGRYTRHGRIPSNRKMVPYAIPVEKTAQFRQLVYRVISEPGIPVNGWMNVLRVLERFNG